MRPRAARRGWRARKAKSCVEQLKGEIERLRMDLADKDRPAAVALARQLAMPIIHATRLQGQKAPDSSAIAGIRAACAPHPTPCGRPQHRSCRALRRSVAALHRDDRRTTPR
eukprot:5941287-Pleurochrysis_carterae.AAC.2